MMMMLMVTMRARLKAVAVAALGVAVVSSCGQHAGQPGPAPAAEPTSASGSTPPPPPAADGGLLLPHRPGVLPRGKTKTYELTAAGVRQHGDHHYIIATYAADARATAPRLGGSLQVHRSGAGPDSYTVAVSGRAKESELPELAAGEPFVLLRIARAGPLGEDFELRYSLRPPTSERAARRREYSGTGDITDLLFRISGIGEQVGLGAAVVADRPGPGALKGVIDDTLPPPQHPIEILFYTAFAKSLKRQSAAPFYRFASSRLVWRNAATTRQRNALSARQRRSDVGELMSLYTGWTSVEEALQTERGLLLRSTVADSTAVALSSLQGVALPEHPWQQMIDALPGKPRPQIEALAYAVAHDMLYLHFHDLRSFALVLSEFRAWAAPLLQTIDKKQGATHFLARYETQLAIARSGLARSLGHLAVKGIAIVAGDPFLREGSDVGVLFDMRSEALLLRALAGTEEGIRKRFPSTRVSHYLVGKQRVRLLSNDDGQVEQHRVKLGDRLVLANSTVMVRRLIEVHQGKRMSLAQSGDFRYMRTVFPFSAAAEDGFGFISDALVAHSVSPRSKILQSRRMQAQADLAAVGYAALLYGWLEGRRPASVDALLGSGLLRPEELRHGDGQEISFSSATGASSGWGSMRRLISLSALPITRVSTDEAAAYRTFARSYQRNWSGFIDPVAVRLRRTGKGRSFFLDARMLPLIDNSDYNDIQRRVGRQALGSPPILSGVQWSMAIGEKARLRRIVNRLSRELTESPKVGVDWLGDWLVVGATDSSGLWDTAMANGLIADSRPSWDYLPKGPPYAIMARRAPLYLASHVRHEVKLREALAALRQFSEGPGTLQWKADPAYREVSVTLVQVRTDATGPLLEEDALAQVKLRYALVGGVLVAALNRPVLEQAIDAVLDRKTLASLIAEDGPLAQTAISLNPAGGDGWGVKTLAGLLEGINVDANPAIYRGANTLLKGLPGLTPADMRDSGLAYLGYEPRCAHGGEFTLNDLGQLSHSIYGTLERPRVPAVPVADSALSDVLRRLQLFDMRLGFEGEGRSSGLRVQLTWRTAPVASSP